MGVTPNPPDGAERPTPDAARSSAPGLDGASDPASGPSAVVGEASDPRGTIRRALEASGAEAPAAGPEPDRRAAVVLVLRPPRPERESPGGEPASPVGGPAVAEHGADAAAGHEAASGRGRADADGPPWTPRRVVADGVVGTERPPARAPSPLFPGRLAPPLAAVEALFVVRVEREGDPWSGQVGLPGGHAEPVDADLRAAALRELREEAGLELAPSDVLGRLGEIRPRSRRLPSVGVTPFVAWHAGGGSVEAGPEVAGHFWAALGTLESPARRTVLTFRRDGVLRAFPGISHPDGVVWGLTFALLRRFLRLLPRAERPATGGEERATDP